MLIYLPWTRAAPLSKAQVNLGQKNCKTNVLFWLYIFLQSWYTIFQQTSQTPRRERSDQMDRFKLHAPYAPTGDQPEAIRQLSLGVEHGRPRADAARRHRLGQDLYHGERDRATSTGPRWCWRTTRRWPRSYAANSRSFSRKTRWNILSPIMTTISRRPICPRPTPISKRTPPSTTRSTSCATPPPRRCRSGGMSSSSPASPASISLGDPIDYRNMVISLRPGMAKRPGRAAGKAGGAAV